MSTIRIRKRIESETLNLPELRPFIGHTVEIVIEETPSASLTPPGYIPGNGDWDAFRRAAAALRDLRLRRPGRTGCLRHSRHQGTVEVILVDRMC